MALSLYESIIATRRYGGRPAPVGGLGALGGKGHWIRLHNENMGKLKVLQGKISSLAAQAGQSSRGLRDRIMSAEAAVQSSGDQTAFAQLQTLSEAGFNLQQAAGEVIAIKEEVDASYLRDPEVARTLSQVFSIEAADEIATAHRAGASYRTNALWTLGMLAHAL